MIWVVEILRTYSEKQLPMKFYVILHAFYFAKNWKYDWCQHELASLCNLFFNKKFSAGAVTRADLKSAIKGKTMTNQHSRDLPRVSKVSDRS